ncbi:MAG: hypothetical protein GTO13_12380 [Proteobacteria bacterium]|nr:hypothetical protein [Pseudomonadota bacterium]
MVSSIVPQEFNLAAFFLGRHLAEGRAGIIAVSCQDQAITDAELAEAATRLGNALFSLGVEVLLIFCSREESL